MLTLRTKFALALLHDIQYKDYQLSTSFHYSSSETASVLQALSEKRLITKLDNSPFELPQSYRFTCPYHNINLLALLEALGEGLYFNHPSDESFYARYGTTARKLGIVNQMTRVYLTEISIAEL